MFNEQLKQLDILLAIKIKQQQHPFHLVDPSPWPAVVSISLFHLMFFNTSLLNETIHLRDLLNLNPITAILFPYNSLYFIFYVTVFGISLFYWFYNITLEASYRGQHSIEVQKMLRNGFLLFIVSEIMFFFSFFWSFFHLSVSPSIFIGGVWPAKAMQSIVINPMGLPFYNTLILVCSGIVVTWFHLHFLYTPKANYFVLFNSQNTTLNNFEKQLYFFLLPNVKFSRKLLACIISLFLTICLGLLFTLLQLYEYIHSVFNISDSVYGSIFYLTTGFHGVHVIVGTLLLAVGLMRLLNNEFTPKHHIGLECAIYYWHFVDVVWLFLYFFLYWWSK